MTEEIQAQEQPQNTVATVGMRFSISGLIAVILIILGLVCLFNGLLFGVILLLIGSFLGLLSCGSLNFFVGFILGIIGLCYKPRKRARIAILIPIITLITTITIAYTYIRSSVKTPAKEFGERAETQLEQLKADENFNEETFGNLVENEINYIVNDKSEEDWKTLFEASTGSNTIEKGSYLVFSILQQGFENALEKYNNGELPEISDDEIVSIDIDVEDNEDSEKDSEKDSEENGNTKKENVEVFTQSEKNDIEQILNILE